jgi:hypothetical protein
MAAVSMIVILLISWWMDVATPVIAIQALVLGCVAAFILSRPSLPRD